MNNNVIRTSDAEKQGRMLGITGSDSGTNIFALKL